MGEDEPLTSRDPAIGALNEKRLELHSERTKKLREIRQITEQIDRVIQGMNELADTSELQNALTGDPLEDDFDPEEAIRNVFSTKVDTE